MKRFRITIYFKVPGMPPAVIVQERENDNPGQVVNAIAELLNDLGYFCLTDQDGSIHLIVSEIFGRALVEAL